MDAVKEIHHHDDTMNIHADYEFYAYYEAVKEILLKNVSKIVENYKKHPFMLYVFHFETISDLICSDYELITIPFDAYNKDSRYYDQNTSFYIRDLKTETEFEEIPVTFKIDEDDQDVMIGIELK